MATQWSNELMHVVKLIGGFESQQVHIGQKGMRFKTVPKAKQAEALQFLLSNAFTVPSFMIKTDVLRRIQPVGAVDRVRTAQTAVLNALLQNQRIDRMTEQLAIDGAATAYSPVQFLADVRAASGPSSASPAPRSRSTAATCSGPTWTAWIRS